MSRKQLSNEELLSLLESGNISEDDDDSMCDPNYVPEYESDENNIIRSSCDKNQETRKKNKSARAGNSGKAAESNLENESTENENVQKSATMKAGPCTLKQFDEDPVEDSSSFSPPMLLRQDMIVTAGIEPQSRINISCPNKSYTVDNQIVTIQNIQGETDCTDNLIYLSDLTQPVYNILPLNQDPRNSNGTIIANILPACDEAEKSVLLKNSSLSSVTACNLDHAGGNISRTTKNVTTANNSQMLHIPCQPFQQPQSQQIPCSQQLQYIKLVSPGSLVSTPFHQNSPQSPTVSRHSYVTRLSGTKSVKVTSKPRSGMSDVNLLEDKVDNADCRNTASQPKDANTEGDFLLQMQDIQEEALEPSNNVMILSDFITSVCDPLPNQSEKSSNDKLVGTATETTKPTANLPLAHDQSQAPSITNCNYIGNVTPTFKINVSTSNGLPVPHKPFQPSHIQKPQQMLTLQQRSLQQMTPSRQMLSSQQMPSPQQTSSPQQMSSPGQMSSPQQMSSPEQMSSPQQMPCTQQMLSTQQVPYTQQMPSTQRMLSPQQMPPPQHPPLNKKPQSLASKRRASGQMLPKPIQRRGVAVGVGQARGSRIKGVNTVQSLNGEQNNNAQVQQKTIKRTSGQVQHVPTKKMRVNDRNDDEDCQLIGVLKPHKYDDNDCQIIETEPENTRKTHSIQGRISNFEDSAVHLSNSITLSIQSTEPQTVPKKSYPKISTNEKRSSSKSRSPAPSVAFNLNNAVSVIPTPKNNLSANDKLTSASRLPTVDLTNDFAWQSPQNLQIKQSPLSQQEIVPWATSSFKCGLCPALYLTAAALIKHCQCFHTQSGVPSCEMGIPLIDLEQPGVLQKLTNLGIYNFIPLLSSTPGGNFAFPIVSVDAATNSMGCNLSGLGASSVLTLGPVRFLPK